MIYRDKLPDDVVGKYVLATYASSTANWHPEIYKIIFYNESTSYICMNRSSHQINIPINDLKDTDNYIIADEAKELVPKIKTYKLLK